MLIDNVDLATQNGSRSINFGFRDPGNRLRYQVKSMSGLDADEIVNHFVGNPTTVYGSPAFYVPMLLKREVVLLLGLNPEWEGTSTFSSLRDDLYRLIGASPSGQVEIRLNYGPPEEDDSHVQAHLVGRISKFEANHFVDRPEVQLTVTADEYPMLEALTAKEVSPVSIWWLAHPELAGKKAVKLIDNVSTAAHGLEAEFTFSGPAKTFKMEGLSDIEGLRFEVKNFTFASGDVLHLRSGSDNRYVYVVRSGVTTHLLDKVTAESVWPILLPGDNYYTWATNTVVNGTFTYGTTSATAWSAVRWTPTFWGV